MDQPSAGPAVGFGVVRILILGGRPSWAAWDRERGEPPLGHGFTPEQEQAILARHEAAPGPE